MSDSIIKDLLLIDSLSLGSLIEDYRLFFLSLLPSVFILALLIEYFDRMNPFLLLKRALISILILCSVSGVYHQSIDASMEAADEVLKTRGSDNILLMDIFSGAMHWDQIKYDKKRKKFFKDKSALHGVLSFLKFHLFEGIINDIFTTSVYFIANLCFLLIKAVYSLVYYLGLGLIGIPCLLYLFPSMGNILRGAFLSFLWCLIIPHILVFVILLIGSEINTGYTTGQIIGGSITGTAFLFLLTLFIAFTPIVGVMMLSGSGMATAAGLVASMGANHIMGLPRKSFNGGANLLTGGKANPALKLTGAALKGSAEKVGKFKGLTSSFKKGSGKDSQNNTAKKIESLNKSASNQVQKESQNSQSSIKSNHPDRFFLNSDQKTLKGQSSNQKISSEINKIMSDIKRNGSKEDYAKLSKYRQESGGAKKTDAHHDGSRNLKQPHYSKFRANPKPSTRGSKNDKS